MKINKKFLILGTSTMLLYGCSSNSTNATIPSITEPVTTTVAITTTAETTTFATTTNAPDRFDELVAEAKENVKNMNEVTSGEIYDKSKELHNDLKIIVGSEGEYYITLNFTGDTITDNAKNFITKSAQIFTDVLSSKYSVNFSMKDDNSSIAMLSILYNADDDITCIEPTCFDESYKKDILNEYYNNEFFSSHDVKKQLEEALNSLKD